MITSDVKGLVGKVIGAISKKYYNKDGTYKEVYY